MKKLYGMSIFLFLAISLDLYASQSFYGIYSNMIATGGEPSGFEMFFFHDGRPGKCSDSVLFQAAEGWPHYPELLDCCGCTANHIEFHSKRWGKFEGKIENGILMGEFIEAKHKISLKKGQSFWQKN